jgi:hypothetical protein
MHDVELRPRVRGTENVMSGRRPTINIELGPQHNNRPQQSHFYCRALLSDLLPLKEQLFVFMPFLLLLLHSFEILVVSLSLVFLLSLARPGHLLKARDLYFASYYENIRAQQVMLTNKSCNKRRRKS